MVLLGFFAPLCVLTLYYSQQYSGQILPVTSASTPWWGIVLVWATYLLVVAVPLIALFHVVRWVLRTLRPTND